MPSTTLRVEAAGFQDGDENAAMAILTNDIRLRNGAICDGGDIFEVDGCAVDLFKGEIAQAGEGGGRAVKADVVFCGADLRGATGLDDILTADRGEDLRGRKAFCLKLLGVEVDHDRALFPAVNAGHDGTGDGNELRPNDVQAVVV